MATPADVDAPRAGLVRDGADDDQDEQTDRVPLRANWTAFADASPIARYEWRIETAAGAIARDWRDVGTATAAVDATLVPTVGERYVALVRAIDAAGNVSAAARSDGVWILGDGPPAWALQVERHGITWRFAAPRPVGAFANGDPWVLAPVDVVAIEPRCEVVGDRTVHGSMVDPPADGVQGYDSTLYGDFGAGRYEPARNRALGLDAAHPLHLDGDHSLVSTQSRIGPDASPSLSQLRAAAVLTALAEVPRLDAFRPPYAGSDRHVRFVEGQLQWARLQSLPRPVDAPPTEELAARFERVWLDHAPGWLSRYLHPVDNMPDYSRDFTADIGTAALLLQLDDPVAQKRPLLVRLVQLGIDEWGNVQDGCSWPGTGGQCSGRKFPILFAGALLDDAGMLAIGSTHATRFFGPGDARNKTTFGEDSQTFFVVETGKGEFNWGHGGYTAADVGVPEWGFSHVPLPDNDAADWHGDPYRVCCTANAWVGQALAAHMMNLPSAWSHPAFFAYMDRYLATEPRDSWTRAWEPWHERMWDRWRWLY
jgi:hypothetical protein